MDEHDLNSLVRRLAALNSCAVSDAKDSLSMPAAISGIARCATSHTIAGTVMTVRLDAADAVPPPSNETDGGQHLCTRSIEAGGPGSIIVVEQRTGIDAGAWGGVLSQAAYQQGIEGVIVEGLARDIDESRAIGFPVFARGATARTARGRIREIERGGAICVGDQEVNDGDLVIADGSGVVFIPRTLADEIVVAAERIAQKEAAMVQAILSGQPVSQVMGTKYETMLQ